jgi:hypothetical protein
MGTTTETGYSQQVSYNGSSIVLPKEQNSGIKVDTVAPTFGWKDITGILYPDTGGANAPALGTFRGGNIRRFSYAVADKCDCEFHIPHDYAMGTDVYVHVHWSHNGTAISGNMVFTIAHSYAKGHNQGEASVYPAEKTVVLTYVTTNIATTPQYIHRVDEVAISSAGGSATLMDTAAIEPDGVIAINLTTTTIPTITGGSPNEPFIFHIDLHYQSTQTATKNKSPDFWT